jgi:spermidine/putrescine transport system permease protein
VKLRGSPGTLLVAPLLVYLGLFLAVPLGAVAVLSFLSRGAYGEVIAAFNPLNYVRLADPLYGRIFGFSFLVAALTALLTLALGYPLAWAIARARGRRRTLLLLGVLVPFWTNFLLRLYAWILILRTGGLLEGVLTALGLARSPLDLLYSPAAVLIGMVYEYLPFMVLPLYASLEKIDDAQLAAATDLGARPLQTFVRVVWPLSLPGVTAGVTLVFVPAMGMFVVSDLLGGARTLLVGNLIRNQFLSARDWPFGAAAAMVLLVLTLGLLLVYHRQTRTTGEDLLL